MKIVTALATAGKNLTDNSPDPILDAEVLLAHVLGCDRTLLIAESERRLTTDEKTNFEKLVIQRAAGRPVAYLTNTKEFCGLRFYVDDDTLIPRPETEQIVDEILNFGSKIPLLSLSRQESPPPFAKGGLGGISLLDLGTGSGCIAVSIAYSLPSVKVAAADISPAALAVARRNAKAHNVKIKFYESDLLADVSGEYDIVVANLPYIGEVENHAVDPEVEKYEPRIALFGGQDGLRLYERLLKQLTKWRTKPKLLICEIGWSQQAAITNLVKKYLPNSQVECLKDLAGHDRIVKITNCK